MYLQAVQNLARYLAHPGLSSAEVCKFLVFETFAQLHPTALYAAEISNDGHIVHLGSFGIQQGALESWERIPLSVDMPQTAAAKTNQILILTQEEAYKRCPVLIGYEGLPQNWNSYLVCPILPFGLIVLVLNSLPLLEEEFELFLRTTGAIVAMYFNRVRHENENPRPAKIHNGGKGQGVLTGRQLTIKSLMEKGYSNPAIAEEIGYSESLVRQETMAIYAALNLSGRKELIENS